ncbi:MAG: NADH-quinone oxidoreductase subunit C [Anaerolineales bacterium]|nr:NADH-quinone oxidoreductase subunit C [Anaerolineales bacterium]
MDETIEKTLITLKDRFGLQDGMMKYPASLVVAPEKLVDVATALRNEFGFNMLSDITASDYYPQDEPRFHVVYNFNSLSRNLRICLRVPLNGTDPAVDSIEGLYHNANWHEREIFDMFGIQINGHSDLRRIIMPYDWVGHPLRKDYPLGYEEPQFTFNYEDIERRKHKARYEEA